MADISTRWSFKRGSFKDYSFKNSSFKRCTFKRCSFKCCTFKRCTFENYTFKNCTSIRCITTSQHHPQSVSSSHIQRSKKVASMATQTVTATVGYHLEVERGGAAVWCPGTVGDKRRPHDHQAVKITDIRPNQSDFTLDTHGFQVNPFHTSATNFDDVDAIREHYYPEVCAHVKKMYV